MTRLLRKSLAIASAMALFSVSAAPASAEMRTEMDNAPPVIDALFLRPLGLVGAAASIALFVPVAAITMVTRPTDIEKPFNALVKGPLSYVFLDPLGEH